MYFRNKINVKIAAELRVTYSRELLVAAHILQISPRGGEWKSTSYSTYTRGSFIQVLVRLRALLYCRWNIPCSCTPLKVLGS